MYVKFRRKSIKSRIFWEIKLVFLQDRVAKGIKVGVSLF